MFGAEYRRAVAVERHCVECLDQTVNFARRAVRREVEVARFDVVIVTIEVQQVDIPIRIARDANDVVRERSHTRVQTVG